MFLECLMDSFVPSLDLIVIDEINVKNYYFGSRYLTDSKPVMCLIVSTVFPDWLIAFCFGGWE